MSDERRREEKEMLVILAIKQRTKKNAILWVTSL